jgi:hypothetical protein
MTSQWTDERLDRFANKVDDFVESSRERESRLDDRISSFVESSRERESRLDDRINKLVGQIDNLIEALHLEVPNIKAKINRAY